MFSLKHFFKLPSIVQILVGEMMMTICLGGLAPYLYRAIRPQQLSYVPPPLDWGDAAFGAIGVALFVWLMWGPLFPRVVPVSWTPSFRGGGAIVYNTAWDVEYGFLTNHPSYVFIDAIVIGFWWFFRWIMAEGNDERLYEANLWVAIACVVPAWRLVCWYILRRRPQVPAGEEGAIGDAWKPIGNLYFWFLLPLAAAFGFFFVDDALKVRKILREMPTIEAAGFSDEVFEKLIDPEVSSKKETRYIRLHAIQRSTEATRCFDKERRPSVTVLADFGAPGNLIIQNERLARDDRNLEALVARAKDNEGKPIEAMGRLLRLPPDREIPSWRRPFYCGLERAKPRPQWVLEESKP